MEIRVWGVLPTQSLCLSSKQNLHCNAYTAAQWNVNKLVNKLWTSQQKLGCIPPSNPSSTSPNRKLLNKIWENVFVSTLWTEINNFQWNNKEYWSGNIAWNVPAGYRGAHSTKNWASYFSSHWSKLYGLRQHLNNYQHPGLTFSLLGHDAKYLKCHLPTYIFASRS